MKWLYKSASRLYKITRMSKAPIICSLKAVIPNRAHHLYCIFLLLDAKKSPDNYLTFALLHALFGLCQGQHFINDI